jgi:hypothetical protein
VKITSTKAQLLIDMLATEWAKCDPELEVAFPGESVPELPTVYFLCNKDDDIQYVGQTKHLNIRLAQHVSNIGLLKRIEWRKTYYFVPGIDKKSYRLAIEGALMLLLRPVGNQALMLRKTKTSTWSEIRWRRNVASSRTPRFQRPKRRKK